MTNRCVVSEVLTGIVAVAFKKLREQLSPDEGLD